MRHTSTTFRSIALACAAFALTVALGHALIPNPDLGDVSDKLAWYEEHRDDVDLLFFGSSRVYRGVVPEVVDRELARRGHRVRSFNFGVPGMGAHETSALVRRVLRMEPRRLRWVVVELDGWDASLHPENRFKKRMISWHDPSETVSALRTVARSEGGGVERLGLAWSHVLHLGARLTGAGRGRLAVEELRQEEHLRRRETDYGEGRGFEPYSESAYGTPSTHPFRRRFMTMVPVYRKAVERLPAANRAAASLAGYNARAVEEQAEAIRKAGARPVHLITPTARPTPELYRLAATGRVPHLMAFNDPERYPDLFAVENRFDAEHLTTAGAERFSRLLAARLVRVLDHDTGRDRSPRGVRIAESR